MFESGASSDSFISKLWPGRRELGALLVPGNRVAGAAMLAAERLRQSRRRAAETAETADAGAAEGLSESRGTSEPASVPGRASAGSVTQVTSTST
jgi:hypothetical protein